MGTFREKVKASNPANGRFKELEAVVDKGATYSQIPAPILDGLGIERKTKRKLKVATGEVIVRDAGIVLFNLKGEILPTLVIFGDSGSEPLIGAVTLEEFGLGIDPVNKILVPVPELMLLMIKPKHLD
ncbi:MAG: hypothetical protein OEW70_08940 [candidate division WOR-3 bacterium]|nr:hypothetical protein [candidate division WOR-3 bacterium]